MYEHTMFDGLARGHNVICLSYLTASLSSYSCDDSNLVFLQISLSLTCGWYVETKKITPYNSIPIECPLYQFLKRMIKVTSNKD